MTDTLLLEDQNSAYSASIQKQSYIHSQPCTTKHEPRKSTWRAPTMIVTSFVLGLGLAITHHLMASKLDGKPVADVFLPQAWIFRFGTALAFLTKLALAICVGTSYVQHQWLELRRRDYTARHVDVLTGALGNAFDLVGSTVWFLTPVLAVMAAISWYESASAQDCTR